MPAREPAPRHERERLLPDAKLDRIDEASHAVALDPVQPFMDRVIRFLTRRYGRGVRTDR